MEHMRHDQFRHTSFEEYADHSLTHDDMPRERQMRVWRFLVTTHLRGVSVSTNKTTRYTRRGGLYRSGITARRNQVHR